MNPAQIIGEALTIGLNLDDLKNWQSIIEEIDLDNIKKVLNELYINKNFVIGELKS